MKSYPKIINDIIIGIILSVCTLSCSIMAIMLGKKSKSKPVLFSGITGIISFVFFVAYAFFWEPGTIPVFGIISFYVSLIMPLIVVLVYLPEYSRRMNLMYTVSEYKINPDILTTDNNFNINNYPALIKYQKTGVRLYKDKGLAVLYAIVLISEHNAKLEYEAKVAYEQEVNRRKEEQKRINEENEKKRLEAIRIENERRIKEAEALRIENERRMKEAEALRIENERRMKEAEALRIENERKRREQEAEDIRRAADKIEDKRKSRIAESEKARNEAIQSQKKSSKKVLAIKSYSEDTNSFNILGTMVTVDNGRLSYNNLRKRFRPLQDKCESSFLKFYNSCSSLDELLINAPEKATELKDSALKECIEILIKNGLYDVDEETFFSKYIVPNQQWSKAYDRVYDKYDDIMTAKEESYEYRAERKKNRGRWTGGGFGVGGAIKGAATAGAMNLASGVGHSIFNGIGNLASSAAASKQAKKVLNSEDTKYELTYGIGTIISAMPAGIIRCLAEHRNSSELMKGIVSAADAQKAQKLINNLKHTNDKSVLKTMLTESFKLDPYIDDWYIFAFNTFGDSDGSLEQLAIFFDISVIGKLKEKKLIEAMESMTIDSEEKAIDCKHRLNEMMIEMNYVGDSECIKKIEEKIIKFRTVEFFLGKTYSFVLNSAIDVDYINDHIKLLREQLNKTPEINYDAVIYLKDNKEIFIQYATNIKQIYPDIYNIAIAYYDSLIQDCTDTEKWVRKIEKSFNELQKNNQQKVYILDKLHQNNDAIRNIKAKYLYNLGYTENEQILMIFDNSNGSDMKRGFVATNKGCYEFGEVYNHPGFIPLKEINISEIKTKGTNIVVNQREIDISSSAWLTREKIAYIVQDVFVSAPKYRENH